MSTQHLSHDHDPAHMGKPGFTLIELLVVISIIALIVGILLPTLGAARKTAQQMKSNTQLRGIHQAGFMYGEDNDNFLPGVTNGSPTASDGWVGAGEIDTYFDSVNPTVAGSHITARWCILLEGKYVASEYLRSPAEINTAFTLWDPLVTTHVRTSLISSYALTTLKLDHTAGSAIYEPRIAAYRSDDLQSDSPMASDRLLNIPGVNPLVSSTHQSLWGTQAGDWRGGMVFNDNHVEFLNTSVPDRRFSVNGIVKPAGLFDNIFTQSTGGGANNGSLIGAVGFDGDTNIWLAASNASVPYANNPDY